MHNIRFDQAYYQFQWLPYYVLGETWHTYFSIAGLETSWDIVTQIFVENRGKSLVKILYSSVFDFNDWPGLIHRYGLCCYFSHLTIHVILGSDCWNGDNKWKFNLHYRIGVWKRRSGAESRKQIVFYRQLVDRQHKWCPSRDIWLLQLLEIRYRVHCQYSNSTLRSNLE